MKWWISKDGYIIGGEKGSVIQHRLVWEIYRGPIPRGHVIHHKNGIRTDNRIENLECLSISAHSRLHVEHDRERGIPSKCVNCGKDFVSFRGKKYCTRICMANASGKKWIAKNPERWKAYQKLWQEANPDKLRAADKKYKEANREKLRARYRAYDATRREEKAITDKARYYRKKAERSAA